MDEQPPLTKRARREQRHEAERLRTTKHQKRHGYLRGLLWAVVAVLIIGAIYGLVRLSQQKEPATAGTVAPASAADWITGKKGAHVTLIEYADFQCPACGAYYSVVQQLEAAYGDRVQFVYREYPLTSIHQHAFLASQTAEAAGKQGKFWEMYKKLYEGQNDWSAENDPQTTFAAYASEIGLDTGQWKSDLTSNEVKEKINADIASGNAAGVDGTPSFFLNGQRIDNPRSFEAFTSLLDDALKNAPLTQAPLQEVHQHADFSLVINGAAFDLSAEKYQSTKEKALDPGVHVHSGKGTIIHTHEAGATLGTFLTSFGMNLSATCLQTDDGKEYCDSGTQTLKLYVNGTPSDTMGKYVIQDLDRILLTYGAEDSATIVQQLEAVPDEACIYSETCPERGAPPTEECVGGLGTDCAS